MSMLLQVSNERYAVIELSSTKSSPERVVVAYPNEETLRGPRSTHCPVPRTETDTNYGRVCEGAAMTKAAAPRQADGLAAFQVEVTQVDPLREQLTDRMPLLPIRRFAASIVQLCIAAAIFIFYSKNIVSAALRAVLAGSL
jgi:hypothetical protein